MEYDDLTKAVNEWWEMKRPLDYSFQNHLDNPTVNCVTESEKKMALALKRKILEGKKSND